MILLVIVGGIVAVFLGLYISVFFDELGIIISTLGGCIAVFAMVFSVFFIGDCAESRIIDEKIAIYQEENDNIEKDIESVVEQYMEHEKEVFKTAKAESPITLIQIYPELKSDALVKQQLEVYQSNNEQIKTLKTKKLECEKSKWLLYFGGKKAEGGGGDE